MKRSKLIFLAIAGLFLLAMLIIGVDISRKTTFPGAKKHLKESLSPSEDSDSSSTSPSQK